MLVKILKNGRTAGMLNAETGSIITTDPTLEAFANDGVKARVGSNPKKGVYTDGEVTVKKGDPIYLSAFFTATIEAGYTYPDDAIKHLTERFIQELRQRSQANAARIRQNKP